MTSERDAATAELFDGAWCPDPVPDGFDGCMVYAGGSSATHAWEPAELDRVAHLPRLVTWVPTPGADNPRQSAIQFRQWLGDHKVPTAAENGGQHVRVQWDCETGTEPDPRWVTIACDYLHSAGYFNLIYGSPAWLFGQPSRAGYVVANPTGVPHLYDHADVAGTQWVWNVKVPGGVIDKTQIRRTLLSKLWMPAAA